MGFHPPRLLRNPHVQSVLSSLAVRRPLVLTRARSALASSRSLILECGDGVRLQGFYSACGETATASGNSALAVLIHGWEGSANSLYVLSAAAYLHARGVEVFRLNLRDHGDTHHLNEDIFHSCRIAVARDARVDDGLPCEARNSTAEQQCKKERDALSAD